MILDENDLAPLRRRTLSHEIGQPLDDLSIEELAERIAMLRAEIDRLETKRQNKEASRAGAEAFFKS